MTAMTHDIPCDCGAWMHPCDLQCADAAHFFDISISISIIYIIIIIILILFRNSGFIHWPYMKWCDGCWIRWLYATEMDSCNVDSTCRPDIDVDKTCLPSRVWNHSGSSTTRQVSKQQQQVSIRGLSNCHTTFSFVMGSWWMQMQWRLQQRSLMTAIRILRLRLKFWGHRRQWRHRHRAHYPSAMAPAMASATSRGDFRTLGYITTGWNLSPSSLKTSSFSQAAWQLDCLCLLTVLHKYITDTDTDSDSTHFLTVFDWLETWDLRSLD